MEAKTVRGGFAFRVHVWYWFQAAAFLVNVIGFGCQPELGVDYDAAAMEVLNCESGCEDSPLIKQSVELSKVSKRPVLSRASASASLHADQYLARGP